jgi:starch synthase
MVVRGSAKPSAPKLRLMFASSELAPLAQTGGLGDAVAGLARALAARGHTLHCALPAHPAALAHPECPALQASGSAQLSLPDGEIVGRWLTGAMGAVQLHLLELGNLYERETIYGGADEALRFAAFGRAVAARCQEIRPQVLIAHDWPAALSLCVLRQMRDRSARAVATVQVVHNNAHQGRFPAQAMSLTGLPGELFAPDGLEFHGDLSLL